MIGIAALAIRYVQRPDRLNDSKPLDGWILALIFAILFTGYIVEGLRIAAQIKLAPTMAAIAYEKTASPIGWIFAGMFSGAALESMLAGIALCGGFTWLSLSCLLVWCPLPNVAYFHRYDQLLCAGLPAPGGTASREH